MIIDEYRPTGNKRARRRHMARTKAAIKRQINRNMVMDRAARGVSIRFFMHRMMNPRKLPLHKLSPLQQRMQSEGEAQAIGTSADPHATRRQFARMWDDIAREDNERERRKRIRRMRRARFHG